MEELIDGKENVCYGDIAYRMCGGEGGREDKGDREWKEIMFGERMEEESTVGNGWKGMKMKEGIERDKDWRRKRCTYVGRRTKQRKKEWENGRRIIGYYAKMLGESVE